MVTQLRFVRADALKADAPTLLIVGTRARLRADDVAARLPEAARPLWAAMLEAVKPGDAGDGTTTWLPGEPPTRLEVAVLPDAVSRHMSPARPVAMGAAARRIASGKGGAAVLVALDAAEHAGAAAAAFARALPLYSRKANASARDRAVEVAFLAPDGEADLARAEEIAEGVRFAARLVDAPTAELDVDAFVAEASAVAAQLDGVTCEVLRGPELAERGLGGIYGVGKAARSAPALVVLSHGEAGDGAQTIAWVGKGIVYDTGGLSLKPKTSMVGMKGDMGGAAAVLAAFRAAVRLGHPGRLLALLCLAENAIGPDAVRPDDILTLLSGKTVEINNTDAEGRLVLADGVVYAARQHAPDVIVDMATLTGAQLVATGKRHAAIVTPDEALEARAIAAGKASGDMVHPLPYAPELFRAEFRSKVADMKNSVKDRANAQSSCAAQFIAEHLDLDGRGDGAFKGAWMHVDIAGPSTEGERATGYGVALLLELLRR